MFRKLQEEEIVDINVEESWFQNIPVHHGEIPEEYKSDANFVKCFNYPDSNDPKCHDFNSNNTDMFGFVQIYSQQQDDIDNEADKSISFPSLESHQE